MEGKMEIDVVSRLHQLVAESKGTLSDVFKAFNLFVRERDAEISLGIQQILETFRPETNVGKLFKVRLIDKYRVSPYVIELLQGDDTLYIAQALKCSWFFEHIDDASNFVDKIVPKLSLVTRMKVINKYALHLKNSEAGDVFYSELKKRYGVITALPALPACSENFIRSELPNIKVPLSPKVTNALFKKYPSLTTEYLQYLADGRIRKRKGFDLDKYESIFVKLARKDLNTFLNLFQNENNSIPYMKLGRRPTKKLLKHETVNVLEAYYKYNRFLVDKILLSRLSLQQFFDLLVLSMFPEKISDFCSGCRHAVRVLKFVKAEQHSNLVLSAFRKKYGVDMTSDDVLFKLDFSWLEFLPREAKDKWIEKMVSDSTDVTEQARYLAQLQTANCLPRIKKLIESQSDATVRSQIVRHMVSTISINRDSKAIKDLFAYLVKRFRNEVRQFREVIVRGMEFKELYLELESNDWVPINEFIDIIKLNKEAPFLRYQLRDVFEYQFLCAFAGKCDVNFVWKIYLEFEMCDETNLSSAAILLCDKTPHRRKYLELIVRELPSLVWADVDNKVDFIIDLFGALCEYNKDNEDGIDIPPLIVDVVEEALTKTLPYSWNSERILQILRKFCPMSRFEKYIVVKVFPEVMDGRMVCRLLRKEPDTILRHVQEVVKQSLKSYGHYSNFFKKCRMYDSFGITSEMVRHCQTIMEVGNPWAVDCPKMLPNAVRVMALLLPPSEFMKIVNQYVPDEKKIEAFSDEIKTKYEIQQAICKSFVDVPTPHHILPLIRKFTVGDFLKLVVGSLVSTCCKVPETEILSLLKEWINCPVSLRKHFLRLTYDVAPIEYRVETCVNVFRYEKNISLRLVLFKLLRHAFIELPSDDSFSVFKSVITGLTVDDDEALKMLIDIEGMDDDYISPYLELLWQLVDTEWGTVLKDGKSQILNLIDERLVVILSGTFCDTLVTHEMTTKLPSSTPSRLLHLYLLKSPSIEIQTARFDRVVSILRPLLNALWDVPSFTGGRVYAIRPVIREITTSICENSENVSTFVSPIQMLTNWKKFLHSVIRPEELLFESLSIDLAINYQQHRSPPEKYVAEVAQTYKSYIASFGKDYGYCLVKVLLEHAPSNHRLALGSELLSDSTSDPMQQLVAIQILKNEFQNGSTDVSEHKDLISRLCLYEHPSVKVAVNELFHSLAV